MTENTPPLIGTLNNVGTDVSKIGEFTNGAAANVTLRDGTVIPNLAKIAEDASTGGDAGSGVNILPPRFQVFDSVTFPEIFLIRAQTVTSGIAINPHTGRTAFAYKRLSDGDMYARITGADTAADFGLRIPRGFKYKVFVDFDITGTDATLRTVFRRDGGSTSLAEITTPTVQILDLTSATTDLYQIDLDIRNEDDAQPDAYTLTIKSISIERQIATETTMQPFDATAGLEAIYAQEARSRIDADVRVLSGQSNAASSNTQALGGDITPDPDVLLWNHAAGQFDVWDPASGYVAYIGGPTETNKNNVLFQEAKYIRKRTGRRQYCILSAKGGESITQWVPATQPMYVDLDTQVTAALAALASIGKTQIDSFDWFHGEADSGLNTYSASVDALIGQLNGEDWFPTGMPILGYELAPQFIQSDYWAQAASDRNPQTFAVSTSGLSFGADGIHLVGADMPELGARAAEFRLGGLGATPLDVNIIRPRDTQNAVTYIVGPTGNFATVNEALSTLSSKWLVGVDRVTLRLQEGAHASFDTSLFNGGFALEIRGWDGAASSFPTAANLSGGEAAARSAIEARWSSWINCTDTDSFGSQLVGNNITLRGLAIFANGEGINAGLKIEGKSIVVFSCAFHGFQQDQVIVGANSDVDYSQVVHYGGLRGRTVFGRIYTENYTTRYDVFVGQSVYPSLFSDAANCGVMCGMDVAEFTGDWCVRGERFSSGRVHILKTDVVKALLNVSDWSTISIGSLNCEGISVGASPANTPETFRASGEGTFNIESAFTIPDSNGRFVNNLGGGRLRFGGNAKVTNWVGTGIEFARAQYPDSTIVVNGAFGVDNATDGAASDIRVDNGGRILTRSIALGSGMTTNIATNTVQADGSIIAVTG